jgi:hypothetical protein
MRAEEMMLALAYKAKALLAGQDAAVLFELDPRGPKIKAALERKIALTGHVLGFIETLKTNRVWIN